MEKGDDRDLAKSILWGREVLDSEADSLKRASGLLGDSFVRAVAEILSCQGKLVVTGMGKSGHVARKISATLASTGTASVFLHPAEALHGDFGVIQAKDCLIAVAQGGETEEVLQVCHFSRRRGVPVIGITGKSNSTLAQVSQWVLDSSVEREACPLNLAPTSSSTVALALGDALAVATMKARGFQPEEFAKLHPGGSLGRRLFVRVADVMRPSEQVPRVATSASFERVLETVTRGSFGISAVESNSGDLVGAITDGDLRRAIIARRADVFGTDAQSLMSRTPKTISDQVLAVDALGEMERRRITSLFVVREADPMKVFGLVRMHDLLAARIV